MSNHTLLFSIDVWGHCIKKKIRLPSKTNKFANKLMTEEFMAIKSHTPQHPGNYRSLLQNHTDTAFLFCPQTKPFSTSPLTTPLRATLTHWVGSDQSTVI